jgi:glycosyltransferase involved in cell wall biosynthesis
MKTISGSPVGTADLIPRHFPINCGHPSLRNAPQQKHQNVNPTFVVFSDDWGRHPSSCQHLFRHITNHYRTLWFNTIGLRTIRFTKYDLVRSAQVMRDWLRTRAPSSPATPSRNNPQVLKPIMFPTFKWKLFSDLNQKLLQQAVRKALHGSECRKAILVSTLPLVPRLFASDYFVRTVYYCVDDFTNWPGVNGECARRLEEETLSMCDLVIATSDHLLKTRIGRASRRMLLTHGVDYEHFSRAGVLVPPPEIGSLPKPVIGMFGVFDQRTDGDLLIRIAREFSQGSMVVIGPTDRDIHPFLGLGNIHFTGRVLYDDLPKWISGIDVCILPYHVDVQTRAINPLKIREYLATGKPVVSTPLPEAVKLEKYLTISDPDSFCDAISHVLQGRPTSAVALKELLSPESWEIKAQQFLDFVLEGLQPSSN